MGGVIDYEVDVECWVEVNSVGGFLRYCNVSVGKFNVRGLKLKGIECMLICCLLKSVSI